MALSLPEACLDISPCAVASLYANLIERGIDGYSLNISCSFPEGLFCHMKIFSDGISASIPPAYFFGECEVKGVVGKRESYVEDTKGVIVVHSSVNLVIGSGNNWDIQMVTGKDLIGLVDISFSLFQMVGLEEMVLDFSDVYLRDPRVRIDNC